MNPKNLTSDQRKRAEEKLSRIAGVLACHIRTDTEGGLVALEIEAAPDADSAAIAREAGAFFERELGLELDASHIRVAKAGETAPDGVEEFPILEFEGRFAFVSVNVVTSREGLRAEVELVRDAQAAFGAATSDNIAAPAWPVVAEATLRAISEYLDDAIRLCLIGVVKAPLGDDEAMLVRVDVVSSRWTKSLAGCALVGGHESQSVVFATLDAVNRVSGKLEFKTSIEYKIQ
jgi:hypothetical protein